MTTLTAEQLGPNHIDRLITIKGPGPINSLVVSSTDAKRGFRLTDTLAEVFTAPEVTVAGARRLPPAAAIPLLIEEGFDRAEIRVVVRLVHARLHTHSRFGAPEGTVALELDADVEVQS